MRRRHSLHDPTIDEAICSALTEGRDVTIEKTEDETSLSVFVDGEELVAGMSLESFSFPIYCRGVNTDLAEPLVESRSRRQREHHRRTLFSRTAEHRAAEGIVG